MSDFGVGGDRMHVAGNADSSIPGLVKYISLSPLSNLLDLSLTIFKHNQSEISSF